MSYLRKCDWRRDLTKREEASCAPVLREKTASSEVPWCAQRVGADRAGWGAREALGFILPEVGSSRNILSSSEE